MGKKIKYNDDKMNDYSYMGFYYFIFHNIGALYCLALLGLFCIKNYSFLLKRIRCRY